MSETTKKTSTEHTPGPWHVAIQPERYFWRILDKDYRFVASVPTGSAKYKTDVAKKQADARLVSAAPDFADGARDFIAYEEAMKGGDEAAAMELYDSASRKLRAAITKAQAEGCAT